VVSVVGVLILPLCWAQEVDERDILDASVYLGYGIDSFAASDLARYLNPDDSGDIKERWVAGFDFAYRLYGKNAEQKLWLYGETVHGVRSVDLDCEGKKDELPLCRDLDVENAPEQTLYILRNATSLEAMVGLRLELFRINDKDPNYTTSFYIKSQAGFLTVADDDDDVVDMYHGAIGLIVIEGRFEGSYLELGYGRNEVFVEQPNDRWIVDALLTWESGFEWMEKAGIYPFAQLYLDSDFGNGADSIQTYLGFAFDMDRLFGREK
jgi:hypothetical protein